MTTDFRALCTELTDKLHQYAETFPEHDVGPLVQRARDLLDLDEPEGEGLADEELKQMLFDKHRGAIEFVCDAEEEAHLIIRNHIKFARTAIAADRARRPTPQPPADGEVRWLVGELREIADACDTVAMSRVRSLILRAAELLQHQRTKPELFPSHYLSSVAPLLWLLWHHQGARSPVGQPIREYLGMGQFQSMTNDEIAAAKQYLPNQSRSVDPRNDSDYDTFPYGTEPLPGDTTWAKTKSKKENAGGGTDHVSPEYLPPV